MKELPAGKDLEQEVDELEDEFLEEDDNPNVFRIRDPLTPATALMLKTAALHELIHNGLIDLNPSYQRDVVWPTNKQIGLIDSIFRNFYVPPIVFAVTKDDEGHDVRICVDGKQRLTSIQLFFDGQIPYRDQKTKKTYWYTVSDTSRSTRAEVPEDWKGVFADKEITCVEYRDLTPSMEREIFQRVQLGMSLTAAEKLQAISSPWAQWIVELEARHVAVDGGLSQVLEWDTKRGRDFQNIACLVCCCDGLPENEHIPTAQKIEKWLSRVDGPPEQFKEDMEQVLKEFWAIARNPQLDIGFRRIGKRLAPVEFIFIGVLLYVLRRRPVGEKAQAIHYLRKDIRSQFRDIRNNSVVARAMWSIINQLETDTSTLLFRDHGDKSRSKKRRKSGTEQEDDDEYRPQPVSNLGKTPKTRSKQFRLA